MTMGINSLNSFDPSTYASQKASDFLKKVDSNGDGGIDLSELQTVAGSSDSSGINELFTRLDSSGDGKIDTTELGDALEKLHAKMQARFEMVATQRAQEMFSQLDTNEDGSIDKSELTVALSQNATSRSATEADDLFAEIDVNEDGSIDQTELGNALNKAGAMPLPPPPPSVSMGGSQTEESEEDSDLDLNGDGIIDVSELMAAASGNAIGESTAQRDTLFAAIDADGDGVISKIELSDALDKAGTMPRPPKANTNDFSQLLQSLRLADEDENDATNESINRYISELQNGARYTQQGSMQMSVDGIQSLFSLLA